MKISGLIEVLQQRLQKHGDVDVRITWEGTTHDIDASDVYMGRGDREHWGANETHLDALLVDGDGSFYKDRFALDETEGES